MRLRAQPRPEKTCKSWKKPGVGCASEFDRPSRRRSGSQDACLRLCRGPPDGSLRSLIWRSRGRQTWLRRRSGQQRQTGGGGREAPDRGYETRRGWEIEGRGDAGQGEAAPGGEAEGRAGGSREARRGRERAREG